jgi:hypothetical protein
MTSRCLCGSLAFKARRRRLEHGRLAAREKGQMKAGTLVTTRGVQAAHDYAQRARRRRRQVRTFERCGTYDRTVFAEHLTTARGSRTADVVHERRIEDVRFGSRRGSDLVMIDKVAARLRRCLSGQILRFDVLRDQQKVEIGTACEIRRAWRYESSPGRAGPTRRLDSGDDDSASNRTCGLSRCSAGAHPAAAEPRHTTSTDKDACQIDLIPRISRGRCRSCVFATDRVPTLTCYLCTTWSAAIRSCQPSKLVNARRP